MQARGEPASRRHAQEPPQRPEREHGHAQNLVLDLQQKSGNAAVSRLIQRAPGDRPASTDAPGHKAPKEEPKKPVADIHGRIIKYAVDQGVGLITIGVGVDQGVKVGMAGSLVDEKGGEYADFAIEQADGRTCSAHVQAIQDQVTRNPNVVIKASKYEDQTGKEF